MLEVMPTIAMWLVYGVSAMFLTLASICAIACIIYPFALLFKGIKENLL